jgi:RNA polymerase sigma factor (sigma-70 family)
VNEIKLMLFKLRRLLRSRGRSADDTDDLIQEAFLRLQIYCREHEVQKTEAFLVRTVLNLSTDMYKRQRSANAAALSLETLDVENFIPPADEVCASQERLLHMKTGLDQLSPRRREVFVLNRIEGYSFPQIAERLGITLSAVEKHAAKAVLQMTDWMDERGPQPQGLKE